ncbi:MAG: hypothetical protein WBU92_01840 [Candidatus Dormiibacterota bacterium]
MGPAGSVLSVPLLLAGCGIGPSIHIVEVPSAPATPAPNASPISAGTAAILIGGNFLGMLKAPPETLSCPPGDGTVTIRGEATPVRGGAPGPTVEIVIHAVPRAGTVLFPPPVGTLSTSVTAAVTSPSGTVATYFAGPESGSPVQGVGTVTARYQGAGGMINLLLSGTSEVGGTVAQLDLAGGWHCG